MDLTLTDEQEILLKNTRDILGQLRDLLADTAAADDDRSALAASIRQLDELFLLVIAGEFNAGKSAFINALSGQTIQKEGVTPTTDKIHLLKYGPEVTGNPGEKGIWIQTAPIDLLRNICIVDTPGTNAIVREHEALTAEFIPRSDLVLFLTSADRPFTESERRFLEQIRDWGKKIVIVINKADILASDTERQEVTAFVTQAAHDLLKETPSIFVISAKQAQQAKTGRPQMWDESGFGPLEAYVQQTLDDDGRFQLKLLNPLGVGHKLVTKQLASTEIDLQSLQEDTQLLADIEGQMTYYNDDMQRNFKGRLAEIDNILYDMEQRGDRFFEEMIRLGRIPDLVRTKSMEQAFEDQVTGDTPKEIELRVGELVDWMVEQDLRQWTAVADHLARRKEQNDSRIVGQGGPREGTLAYDRQRLVNSIGEATRRAVETYDREKEAADIAEGARTAVVGTGLAGVGAGVGIAVTIATAIPDVTGVLSGMTVLALGLFILPARRRRAKEELATKMAELREKLVNSLTEQFGREMRRGAQRIEDTVSPFSRFVRAEHDKITVQREELVAIEAHILGLQTQLKTRSYGDYHDA